VFAVGFGAVALAFPLAANARWAGTSPESGYWHWMTHARPSERTTSAGVRLAIDRAARLGPQRLVEVASCVVPRTLGWRLWSGGVGRSVAIALGACLMLLIVRRLAKRSRASDAFAILYFCVLVFWPWDEGVRLMAPLTPILYGVIVESAIELGQLIRGRRWWFAAGLSAAALGLAVHFAEFGTVMSRARLDGAKFAERMARGEAIAARLRSIGEADASIVGLTRDGDDAKVDLELGAYLARRRIETIDCLDSGAAPGDLSRADWAIVHRRVVPVLDESSAWRPRSAVLDFVLFERSRPVGVAAR
jgi:hypothetical protein